MKLSELIKTDNIINISPEDTLSHALGSLASSHDSAFVTDKDGKLLGVVNPYYALIKNSHPANAKVSHCMTMPPKLTQQSNIPTAIRLMSESKIHYLPVVDDDNKLIGIVSARRLLSRLADSPRLKVSLSSILKGKRSFVSIDENETIAKAIHLFKDSKISKLVVTNGDGKLKGVLAYYDLISYLTVPKQRVSEGDKKGQKAPFLNYKVRNFMKSLVLTLEPSATVADAVTLILDKKIGSVVVADKTSMPVGIVTTKDILKVLTQENGAINFEVVGKNLSHVSSKLVDSFTYGFRQTISKNKDLQKATLVIKEEKNGSLFEVLFSGLFRKGTKEVIRKEGRDLQAVLSEVKDTFKSD